MNYEDIYRTKVEEIFEDHDMSLERTLTYISHHKLTSAFRQARRELSESEKNRILIEMALPF